jgi:hypothetical protein
MLAGARGDGGRRGNDFFRWSRRIVRLRRRSHVAVGAAGIVGAYVALGHTCAVALPYFLVHKAVHYFTATKLSDNEVEKKRIEEGRSKKTEIEAWERALHLVMNERASTGDIWSGNGGLRHEQAAGELGGRGTPSHGQRQGRAVDEEGVMEKGCEWGPVPGTIGMIGVGSKPLIELKGPGDWGTRGAAAGERGCLETKGRSRKPRVTLEG